MKPEYHKKFSIYDFTISNHEKINEIGRKLEKEPLDATCKLDLSLWNNILTTLDIWFSVGDDDIHYVCHILPNLDWSGGNLGIRLQYEPKDIEKFYIEYKRELTRNATLKTKIELFPKNMIDFLSKSLSDYFTLRYYILDPSKKDDVQDTLGESIEENPLVELINIDEINPQRGLTDEVAETSTNSQRHLSQLLNDYYNLHLDPSKEPTESDINALNAIEQAQKDFTNNMNNSFKSALLELGNLAYPGFHNPNITLNPHLKHTEGLTHNSAVKYEHEGWKGTYLPETYNGLGYQNLSFIAFRLIQFRDAWMKIGKQRTTQPLDNHIEYPTILLVLVEEPEAHLHHQAQQVFIKEAYKILRNKPEITNARLSTQLVITTHSSHITHECEFSNLRYFKRIQPQKSNEIQSTEVINLSHTFGENKDTMRFVSRYIKLTHCDLFFEDAAILIEGDAERILLPQFLHRNEILKQSYISILSIGGSHAHRLEPLMKSLGIPTLIITDLDPTSLKKVNGKKEWKSVPAERGTGQKTRNPTLKKWFPEKESIDDLLEISAVCKIQKTTFPLCVAYQIPIKVEENEYLPSTFEDSLIIENKTFLKTAPATNGMIGKIIDNIDDKLKIYEMIRNFKKAEFALDLLYLPDFDNIKVPEYISEGLVWLADQLRPESESTPLNKNNMEIKDD